MKNYLVIVVVSAYSLSADSQTGSTKAGKKFKPSIATIETIDNTKRKGWFYKMDDNTIYLLGVTRQSRSPELNRPEIVNNPYRVEASKINSIELRKRGAGLKGAFIGLAAGVIAGILTGPINNKNESDLYRNANGSYSFDLTPEFSINGPIALGIGGSLLGFLCGKLACKKFIIGGKKEIYHDLQAELMQRLIIK